MEKQNVEYLKRLAKTVKKEKGITHTEALDLIARERGYQDWKDLISKNK